nr:hypothetical protein [Tanacetum cinerariifolium]
MRMGENAMWVWDAGTWGGRGEDRKKVIITKDSIRHNLRLDDADSVDCLPNEKIFSELVRMGYKKPSTKLTFYKNEFSSSIALAVICLATEDEDDVNEVFAEPTPPLPTPATPPPPPQQEHIPSLPQAKTAQPLPPPP